MYASRVWTAQMHVFTSDVSADVNAIRTDSSAVALREEAEGVAVSLSEAEQPL